MDTTLENQVTEYTADSSCATGNCPIPTLDEVGKLEDAPSLAKGDLVIFNLRGKKRSGTVISKGKVHLGIDLTEMISNTKIPAETEFVELKGVKVFVEKALLDVEAEQAA